MSQQQLRDANAIGTRKHDHSPAPVRVWELTRLGPSFLVPSKKFNLAFIIGPFTTYFAGAARRYTRPPAGVSHSICPTLILGPVGPGASDVRVIMKGALAHTTSACLSVKLCDRHSRRVLRRRRHGAVLPSLCVFGLVTI